MDLELATVEDMAHELARRGQTGLIVVDDLAFQGDGSAETFRGPVAFGHPIVCLGLLESTRRRLELDIDKLYGDGDDDD